ncbi:MAG: metal-dependent hydrolase [Gemmatimonadales bacterium]
MQLGHVPLALSIATYDWNPKTAFLCLAMHFIPNADSLVERSGLAGSKFHCTVTHTTWFAVVMSALVAIWSPHYAIFTFVAIMTHFAADIGSTVGLPLLWPFSKRSYTLALFKDTGYWGKEMYIGYYKQPMSWVLEGGVIVFFIYRLYKIGVIG